MTQFEQMLIDKGYIKYIFNCKTMKYEIAKGHVISTMQNLDYRYFHKSDINKQNEICFGLNEYGKPATLISPRPRIKVKRTVNGKQSIQNELFDDSMNIVLKNYSNEYIFNAMYDKSIIIEVDLI